MSPSGKAAKIQHVTDLVRARQFDAAQAAIEPLLKLDPRNAELLSLAARVLVETRRHEQAVALATRALAVLQHPEPYMLRADALRALGRTDEAIADFSRAARLAPQSAELRVALASAYEEAGRIQEAREALEQATAMYRDAGQALPPKAVFEHAKLMIRDGALPEAIAEIDRVLPAVPVGSVPHLMLLFTRAKACDKAGDYASAWESAQRAHAAARRPFDPAAVTTRTDERIALWTRDRMRHFPSSGVEDPTPIFIAGMPRSGTSLVDQIVHAHPRGAGVGELDTLERFAAEMDAGGPPSEADSPRYASQARDYVRQVKALAPKADRTANKALDNGFMLGHLSRLFLATRIVAIRRDPRDVAVSCVLGAFNSAKTPWIARPEWVAHAWREHERLMAHWRHALDVPILDVRYEELAQQGPPQIRRIIEFLGLPWDDAVLAFHQSKRTVRTLSYDQVSKPLYATAVGRWRHYERWLAGVEWPG